jgi:hypothetical protein
MRLLLASPLHREAAAEWPVSQVEDAASASALIPPAHRPVWPASAHATAHIKGWPTTKRTAVHFSPASTSVAACPPSSPVGWPSAWQFIHTNASPVPVFLYRGWGWEFRLVTVAAAPRRSPHIQGGLRSPVASARTGYRRPPLHMAATDVTSCPSFSHRRMS